MRLNRAVNYIGRFAPSPTGPLHIGSLVAALASYLDARAHGGQWLLRIEDIDPPREQPGASQRIIDSLQRFGFVWDGPIEFQSRRTEHYRQAFERLHAAGQVFACACSRKEIGEGIYPGTCRLGMPASRVARAWRVRTQGHSVHWSDRWLGHFDENLEHYPGDFVVYRADGLWAYQLAVVVDDALQGVNHVVRGDDLLDSTARQILLQQLLGYTRPQYLHIPVVKAPDGQKLSKQTGAAAIDDAPVLTSLQSAAAHLGLEIAAAARLDNFWDSAIDAWRLRDRAQGSSQR